MNKDIWFIGIPFFRVKKNIQLWAGSLNRDATADAAADRLKIGIAKDLKIQLS